MKEQSSELRVFARIGTTSRTTTYGMTRLLPELSSSTVSDAVLRLERCGLIDRPDPEDGRGRRPIQLSSQGRQLYEDMLRVWPDQPWTKMTPPASLSRFDEGAARGGECAKVLEPVFQRDGLLGGVIRQMRPDPVPPAILPRLRRASEGFPRLEALSDRKLVPMVVSNILGRVKRREGPLSRFVK
jgi:hypothetical protein